MKKILDVTLGAKLFLVLLVLTGIMAVFKVPFYSFVGVVCIMTFMLVFLLQYPQELYIFGKVIYSIFALSFLLLILVDEGVIMIAWEIALIPLQILIVFLSFLMIYVLKTEYGKMKKENHPLWSIAHFILGNYFLFSCLVVLFKIYFYSFIILLILFWNSVVNFFFAFLFTIYPKELKLLISYSYY